MRKIEEERTVGVHTWYVSHCARATNHVEHRQKDKHIQGMHDNDHFPTISPTTPRKNQNPSGNGI